MKKLILMTAILCVLIFIQCGTTEMTSIWCDRAIKIDGIHDDWDGVLTYLDKKNISIGLLNDENFLYACLVTGDRQVRSQILRMGFTLWFDVNGGKDKKYGIRFPIGLSGVDPERLRERLADTPKTGLGRLRPPRLNDLEILGPAKKEKRREKLSELVGLEVKLNTVLDALVYEIKVPLVSDSLYSFSLNIKPGDVLGVGLETAEIDMRSMRAQIREAGGGSRGGMRGGGRRGRGMGRESMGGGMGRGMQTPEPLKLWAKIQLAAR